ncbi:helix-turn-helix transcriptional regulator [Clostridium ganghwense]|uniref:Helix-turn-helix transcriptional regulator n=1 Tax=Clostridium ganghwense TaxID=312089 RepID=A0ABT4CQQ9_9CLOT|nr:helix-turn-helix transcriptional regulator [Clostridium ganghwense]MCY6371390.1 helix-turn-helix transcriptional regulator [Clostridium ganghwense]
MKIKKDIFVKFNLNSTFTKLISSYLIIISVILFIASLTFYTNYKKLIIKQGIDTSTKTLHQADYYTNFNLNWSKSFLYELYLDNDIHNLMYTTSPELKKAGLTKLKDISSISSNIDSIYIYNKANNCFYSSLDIKLQPNYENTMETLLLNTKETFSSNFIPNKITITSKEGKTITKNILSIFLSNVASSNNKLPDGAIILNINADMLGKYFKQNYEIDNTLFAINTKGEVVLDSNPTKFLCNISSKIHIKSILNSHKLKDNFTSSIDNKTYFITYTTSKNTNLKFINIIPYEDLLGKTKEVMNSLFFVALILFLLGIILAYIMSNKIYAPINKIVNRMKSTNALNNNSTNSKTKNELEYLSDAIDDILSQPASLQRLSLEEIVFIRKRFLKDLLVNDAKNVIDYNAKFNELDIKIDMGNLIVVVFKIDFVKKLYDKYSTKTDRRLIRFGIKNVITEILSTNYQTETIIVDNTIVAILSINQEIDNTILDTIISCSKNIQNNIFESLNISLSASIGDFAKDIFAISKSYTRANKYLNYTFKYGSNAILYEHKISKDLSTEYKYDENIERALFEAIKLGKISKVETQLDKMFNEILNYYYDDMILAITNLAINSEKLINNLYNINNENSCANINNFIHNLNNLETIEDAKLWLLDLYKSVIDKLTKKKLNKTNVLVNDVKKYIHNNFSNSSLSIDGLADQFNISPNYLRSIFKNTAGKSISKYIADCRFDKAKSLLNTTDLPVIQISSKVGYNNSNYFYTAFKKTYGISPSQYRKMNKIS